ncbi:MAG: polyprenyl synthetase family protein [Caldisericia bacterium]|nr:polyprenyl synthetase family protein [Caldisericia bacterium]
MNERVFLQHVNAFIKEYQYDLAKSISIPLQDIDLMQKGKRYRSLFLYYNPFLLSPELKVRYAAYIELIHTASLLHDDIIDHSHQRRGLPTLNSLYPISMPISSGFFLFSKIIIELSNEHPKVYSAFCSALTKMSLGQIQEIENHSPSFSVYLTIISLKTSSLFALASGIMENGFSERESSLGHNYGIAFQIIDDVLDYMGNENMMDKPIHLDALSDIYTLPIVLEKRGVSKDSILVQCKDIIHRYVNQCKAHSSSGYYQKPIQKISEYMERI